MTSESEYWSGYSSGLVQGVILISVLFIAILLSDNRLSHLIILNVLQKGHQKFKKYNHERRPKRIFLIRHGESEGNVDRSIYVHTPDSKIKLTQVGLAQARTAGQQLKAIIGQESVLFYVSPFERTRQTATQILLSFTNNIKTVKEDPAVREQEWGNFLSLAEREKSIQERKIVGSFFYRFPSGESGADVYHRAATFLETLYRQFDSTSHPPSNIVIVSHGLFIRCLLMRYFHYSITQFENLTNFGNCEFAVMQLNTNGSYQLAKPLKEHDTIL